MIPQTFPSVLDSDNRTKMVIYMLSNITGLTKWIDYIPVKSPANEGDLTLVNKYEANGFIYTTSLSDIAGKQAWLDYIPVYIDGSATTSWSDDEGGYIPMSGLAALLLDFTTMASLDSRITFSRTSNATVTNSLGNIGYAPHNLLTYSEQFDNAVWAKTGATISTNSIASPNGTTTGDFFVEDTGLSEHRLRLTSISKLPSQDMTFSVYVKPNGRFFTLSIEASGSGLYTNFDVLNNTYNDISVPAGWTRKTTVISNVGNGWYRCSISGTTDTGTSVNVRISLANTFDFTANQSYTGNGTSGIYVWGAQIENGASPTTYNSTTVKNLLGYTEAFDNAAWTKSNSFVQTNLLTYSEAFDNAAWTKDAGTITANTTISPNGYSTADLYIPDVTSTNTHRVRQTSTSVISTLYSVSFYVKYAGYSWVKLRQNTVYANFNISTGVVGSTNATTSSITSVGNGWYRISMTLTAPGNSDVIYIQPDTGDTASVTPNTFAGDGTSGVYIWGAQLVQGTDAGAYRRTDAAALPVFYANHNGVVCAEKLVENTATNYHAIYGTTITAGTYMASIYAKAGEKQFLQLAGGASVNDYITFNLALGTITQTGSGATLGSITAAGNGYYRCSARIPLSVSGVFITACSTGTGGWLPSNAGDGTSGIYIFGAQLSDSASLDPYVLNAAAAPSAQAYYGARFDYDPVTLAPKGLLIEEQRTNLLTYSDAFNNGIWAKTNSTINANLAIAPDGTLTANALLDNSTNGGHIVSQVATYSAGQLTASVYVKANSLSKIMLYSYLEGKGVGFDVSNGTTFTVSGISLLTTYTITPASNGFYRCSVTTTASVGATATLVFGIYTVSGTSFGYAGTGQSVYIWGAQLEAGAFATSYIPTAASSVTRAADVAVIQGSNFYSWYNRGEGTLNTTYFFAAPTSGSINKVVAFDPIAAGGYATICVAGGANTGWFVSGLDMSTANAGVINKQAIAYNSWGGFSGALNNVLATPATTSDYTGASTALYLGQRSNGQYMNGTIKQISYYPQRLSDSVLKGLTA